MEKLDITPYDFPRQRNFLNRQIVTYRNMKRFIKLAVSSNPTYNFYRFGPWMNCNFTPPKNVNKSLLWGPKLYVGIEAHDYWSCIDRLVDNHTNLNTSWKFYCSKIKSDRPDRIVFYPTTQTKAKVLKTSLTKMLSDMDSYQLSHCKYDSKVDFVGYGADPLFLDRISWRFYRVIVLAWANINKDNLEQEYKMNLRSWLQKMNISLESGGPIYSDKDLTPKEKKQMKSFILSSWEEIYQF